MHEAEQVEDWEDDAVKSLSMRGAQREVTGYYLEEGYEPVDRWVAEEISDRDGEILESSLHFRLRKDR